MEGFLQTALSFPTVLFSFLLILAIIYWGIVALGMVEIDVLDLDAESVVDGAGQAEGLAALLAKLKLNGVPVTLVLTLLSFFAWFLCYFVQLWLLSALPLGWLRYPLGAVVAVGALFLAAPLAATLCRPLRPLFRKLESTSSKSVLGQVAVVRSGRVTLQHGEALLEEAALADPESSCGREQRLQARRSRRAAGVPGGGARLSGRYRGRVPRYLTRAR